MQMASIPRERAKIYPLITGGAPTAHGAHGCRLVFILARPLEAVPYANVAAGSFPYLHWAVFISPRGAGIERMTALFDHLQNDSPYSRHNIPLGIIHELRLELNQSVRKCDDKFTTEKFLQKFLISSIAYVGLTSFDDNVITDLAQRIWLLNPDYRLLKNNCQHFASSLVQNITYQVFCPRTISEIVGHFVRFSPQPPPKLRSSVSSPNSPGIRRWLTGGSISSIEDSPPRDAWESLGSIGLNSTRIPWLGVQQVLQKAEREYLRSLGFTNPLLVQDFFWITEDDQPHRPSKAVCILFKEILLLCRYHTESSLTSFDHTPANLRMVKAQEPEKLFVYGYLYPRHISRVSQTVNGFRIECEGIWLGEDKVTQWLNLNFQPCKPGEEIRREWIYALNHEFKNGAVPEISTIIDRLPLDTDYAAEIDIQIDLQIYRTVLRGSLDAIDKTGLEGLVRRKLQHYGRRSPNDTWTLQYKDRHGRLWPVTDRFPHDTNYEWREFYAAVFFVDFTSPLAYS